MVTTMPEMFDRAADGSKTAMRYVAAIRTLNDAVECLQKGTLLTAMSLLNSAYKCWDLLPLSPSTTEAFIAAASKILEGDPDNDEALFVLLKKSSTGFDVLQQVIK